jgi:hypothetical protein
LRKPGYAWRVTGLRAIKLLLLLCFCCG